VRPAHEGVADDSDADRRFTHGVSSLPVVSVVSWRRSAVSRHAQRLRPGRPDAGSPVSARPVFRVTVCAVSALFPTPARCWCCPPRCHPVPGESTLPAPAVGPPPPSGLEAERHVLSAILLGHHRCGERHGTAEPSSGPGRACPWYLAGRPDAVGVLAVGQSTVSSS